MSAFSGTSRRVPAKIWGQVLFHTADDTLNFITAAISGVSNFLGNGIRDESILSKQNVDSWYDPGLGQADYSTVNGVKLSVSAL